MIHIGVFVFVFLVGMLVILFYDSLIGFKDVSFCTMMGWHKGGAMTRFDGCSVHAVCKRCGKEVMQDGQGNWF